MAGATFIPRADKDKAAWLKNFANKFSGYATTFGFTAADVTAVNNDSISFSYQLDILELFKTETQELTAYKDLLRDGPLATVPVPSPSLPIIPPAPTPVAPGIYIRISNIVKRIKAHPAYTESIGKDLGIVASASATIMSETKPKLKLSTDGGLILVNYVKNGMPGIRLLGKRASEMQFTLLSVVTQSVYKDIRPNAVPGTPEIRQYLAWYFDKDEPVGQISDVVSITI